MNSEENKNDNPGGSHNLIIGNFAGYDLTNESNVIIIGDNIRNLDKTQKGVLFLNDKIAIGKTIGGIPCNLQEILLEIQKVR